MMVVNRDAITELIMTQRGMLSYCQIHQLSCGYSAYQMALSGGARGAAAVGVAAASVMAYVGVSSNVAASMTYPISHYAVGGWYHQ